MNGSVRIREFTRVRDGVTQTVPAHERRGRAIWSDEKIIEAIQLWVELYGDPPSSADWNPSLARTVGTPARQARYLNGRWPATATVARHFGSWVKALAAAGFEPNLPGPRDGSLAHSRAEALSRRNLARLRGRATTLVGPAALTRAVKAVAVAEKTGEPELLQDALLELAAVAVAWADRADR